MQSKLPPPFLLAALVLSSLFAGANAMARPLSQDLFGMDVGNAIATKTANPEPRTGRMSDGGHPGHEQDFRQAAARIQQLPERRPEGQHHQ